MNRQNEARCFYRLIPASVFALNIISLLALSNCTTGDKVPIPTHSITNPATNTFEINTRTLTHTQTNTFTTTPTSTSEPRPTITPNPHNYIFPIRPDQSVGYAEGVSSHGYPAIDIFAPLGWEYVAVTDGIVEFVSFRDTFDPVSDDPNTRGGIAISIIGDDGLRYYGSHLSKIADGIASGNRVVAGDVIGYIGESGNSIGRGVHLHFGISRPTFPEDWKIRRGEINPFPYLNAWAAGINITPKYATPTPHPTP